MTDVTLLSLFARGLKASAGMLQLKELCQRCEDINLDFEVGGELLACKAQFEAFAKALSSRTRSASAADMEMALRHATLGSTRDPLAWAALIEKLTNSESTMDKEMAKALRKFA